MELSLCVRVGDDLSVFSHPISSAPLLISMPTIAAFMNVLTAAGWPCALKAIYMCYVLQVPLGAHGFIGSCVGMRKTAFYRPCLINSPEKAGQLPSSFLAVVGNFPPVLISEVNLLPSLSSLGIRERILNKGPNGWLANFFHQPSLPGKIRKQRQRMLASMSGCITHTPLLAWLGCFLSEGLLSATENAGHLCSLHRNGQTEQHRENQLSQGKGRNLDAVAVYCHFLPGDVWVTQLEHQFGEDICFLDEIVGSV